MHLVLTYIPKAIQVLQEVESLLATAGITPEPSQDCNDTGYTFSYEARRESMRLTWQLDIESADDPDMKEGYEVHLEVTLRRLSEIHPELQLTYWPIHDEWKIEHASEGFQALSYEDRVRDALSNRVTDQASAFTIIAVMAKIFTGALPSA